MTGLDFLKKKLKKLEAKFESNPSAKIRNKKILKQAEKINEEIYKIEKK